MTYSLLRYLSVSVLCLLFALPLSAQESVMEQFMSAHSMSMLTADSVDPNHHDLVITALAMQQLTMTDQPAHPADSKNCKLTPQQCSTDGFADKPEVCIPTGGMKIIAYGWS